MLICYKSGVECSYTTVECINPYILRWEVTRVSSGRWTSCAYPQRCPLVTETKAPQISESPFQLV